MDNSIYRDETPMTGDYISNDIGTIAEAIRHKKHGVDTRDAMAQSLEKMGLLAMQGIKDPNSVARQAYDMANKAYDVADHKLEAKLAQMSIFPEVFSDIESLKRTYPNGKTGLFITVSTGHKWIWYDGNWKDCGDFISSGTNGMNALIHGELKLPYNDFDALPTNSTVVYSEDISNVKNAPKNLPQNQGGTVVTYNYSSKVDAGKIQILTLSNNTTYTRVSWGVPARYGEWNNNLIRSGAIDTTLAQQKYSDMNEYPNNSLYVFSTDISKLKNGPQVPNNGAIVYTLHSVLTGYDPGTFQIAILDNRNIMFRFKWGRTPNWKDWESMNGKPTLVIRDTSNEYYLDFNNLKGNKTIIYAFDDGMWSKVDNKPLNSSWGTLHIYGDGASDAGTVQILTDIRDNIYYRINWGSTPKWHSWQKVDTNRQAPSISMFSSIGVIGDSYASGELAFDNNYKDHYEISWGQILGRKNGIKVTNFSKGGLTTQTWLTNEHGLSLLNSSDICDLYILALGINDYSRGKETYLGTTSDISTQSDTFYGNYSKIINAIKSKAPGSKIIISTIAYKNDLTDKYNDAIRKLATHFNIPVIDQQTEPFFSSDYYLNHMQGGHPTGPVYSGMAKAMQNLIEQSMSDNLLYFETFKK